MLLKIAVVITALGFTTWILGAVFEYRGMAALGAVLVVGVGAMITVGGLEHRDGEKRVYTYENESNETVKNETVVEPRYSTFEPAERWPLGPLWMLVGAVAFFRALAIQG